jgi:hypothetical protein
MIKKYFEWLIFKERNIAFKYSQTNLDLDKNKIY